MSFCFHFALFLCTTCKKSRARSHAEHHMRMGTRLLGVYLRLTVLPRVSLRQNRNWIPMVAVSSSCVISPDKSLVIARRLSLANTQCFQANIIPLSVWPLCSLLCYLLHPLPSPLSLHFVAFVAAQTHDNNCITPIYPCSYSVQSLYLLFPAYLPLCSNSG